MTSVSALHPNLSALVVRLQEDTTIALDPREPGDRLAIRRFSI